MSPATQRVVVNGAERQLPPGATVSDVVTELCGCRDGVAVAVNGEIVTRGSWGETRPVEGDRIEILTAAAGG